MQRHAAYPRGAVPAAAGEDRTRPHRTARRTHPGLRAGEVRAAVPEQAALRHELLRLALRAGRSRQAERLEQLEAAHRAGARAARHGPHAQKRAEPEGLHGLEGLLLLAGGLRDRHHVAAPAGEGHLPHAAGRTLPHRHDHLRVPRQVPRAAGASRYGSPARAAGRCLRHHGARCRARADHGLPQGAGLLQLHGQQH